MKRFLTIFLVFVVAVGLGQSINLSGPTTPESVRTAIVAMKTDGTNASMAVSLPGNASISTSLDVGYDAMVGTTTSNTGYALSVGTTIATGGAYIMGDVSAESFTDRSDAPESLEEAYAIIQSHESKDGKVDHTKLHSKAWGTKYRAEPTGKTLTKTRTIEKPAADEGGEPIKETETYTEPEMTAVAEPDQSKRNLSLVISAQAMCIADLTKRLEALEAR